MKYFDAHSHYLNGRFKKDKHSVLSRIQREGVEYVVDSFGMKDLPHALALAKKHDFYYMCINDWQHYGKEELDISVDSNVALIEKLVDETVEKLKKLCSDNKKIVGYGECWMDFRRSEKTPDEIRKASFWLSKDLEVARRVGLPAVIHSGNADQESFDLISKTDMPDYGNGKGMMHCYLGPPDMAMEYINMGYLISVTGLVTHKSLRGRNLVEVVKKVPLEYMVIETDCPYLTPEPFRGRRNDSSLLRITVEEIAKLKNVSQKEVADITLRNAKLLFGIK